MTPALQGNQITVLVKEMKAGNYSCHLSSSGQYLNHTLILVQLDPDNRTVILEEKSPGQGERRKVKGRLRGNHRLWDPRKMKKIG